MLNDNTMEEEEEKIWPRLVIRNKTTRFSRRVARVIFPCCMTVPVVIETTLPANGLCSLFTFVPFSNGNESFNSYICDKCNNVGMSHAAAALMAIEHFNARNNTVVPELDQFRACPVQFDTQNSAIFDTGSYTHLAAETLLAQPELPCAVAGPFHDGPALELSTLAAALKFPVTAHRAFSIRALAHYASPYTSQVFPDVITSALVLAEYLLHIGRTDFVAFVYSLTETGLHRQETVSIVLDEVGIKNQAFSYNSPFSSPATSDERTIKKTLQAVLDSGYRTIVVAPELPANEIPLLARTATDLGLTNGDYLWLWFGDFDFSFEPYVREFLAGSIFMPPFEGHHLGLRDPFLRSWKSQGPLEVERLNRANPVMQGQPGYFFAKDDYFQKKQPEWGSAYMYDAIMSTGIGACLALASAKNKSANVPVEAFVQGIRSVNFTGATGVIRFCFPDNCQLQGSRDPYTLIWGVLNLYPPGVALVDGPWQLSEIFYFPQVSSDFIFPNGSLLYDFIPRPDPLPVGPEVRIPPNFLFVTDTVYADGRTVPPDLLRDPPEQNYLSSGIRIAGFILFGVAVMSAVISAIWVFVYHKHRVVKAAQPYFLYLICLGAVVSVSSIVMLSFDESSGWSEEQLSRACMATPWLVSLGHIITYGALFSKLWRLNRVLQFVRRKVDIIHVAWPSAILVAMALLVLGLWTGLDSLEWNRYEINPITGESIGECSSDNAAAYIISLGAIMLIPTLLTFYMAWKTKDVDDTFSESCWIFVMILIQLEVLLFAVPLIPLLRGVSTNGRYIGYSLLIWTFSMSALLLIIGPKVIALCRGDVVHRGPKRGTPPGQVRVSGLSSGSSEQRHSLNNCSTEIGTQTDPWVESSKGE